MKNYLFTLFLLIPLFGFAQNSEYLRIVNPQEWWQNSEGIITQADFEVEITDLHAQVDMYLEFKAPDHYFYDETLLEIDMNFSLPNGSRIIDSWLYIEDYISEGILVNKWAAVKYYENVVNRQKDPSILTKLSNNSYNIKIYPMKGNGTRKIKIRYLLPLDFEEDFFHFNLPTNILSLSHEDVFKKTTVKVISDQQPVVNSDYYVKNGNQYSFSGFDSNDIEVQIGNDNDLKICTYNENDEKFYQIHYPTSEKMNGGKYTIILDFDADHTYIDSDVFISNIKSILIDKLDKSDQFNIVYSDYLYAQTAFDHWVDGTNQNIINALQDVSDHFALSSNIPSLLAKGINMGIGENVDQILVISSGGNHGGSATIPVINQLKELMKDNIVPMFFADFHTKNKIYYSDAGGYYGNQQLFAKLAGLTAGSYNYGFQLDNLLPYIFKGFDIPFDGYKFNIDINDGLTYQTFNSVGAKKLYHGENILEVGKFLGEDPFDISFSVIDDGVLLKENHLLDQNKIPTCNENTIQIHAGYELQGLENTVSDNSDIKEIIIKSRDASVLSKYTAFLCLEKGMVFTDTLSFGNDDGGGIVSTENIDQKVQQIAYPNPFQDKVTIEVSSNTPIDENNIVIQIFNMNGVLVDEIINFEFNDNTIKAIWESDLPSQIYICRILAKDQFWNIKLVKI